MTTMTLTPAAIAEARETLTSQTKSQLAEMIGYTENLKSIKKDTLVEKALEWLTTNNPAIAEIETIETAETENTQKEEENVMTTEITKTATAEPKAEKKERKPRESKCKKLADEFMKDIPESLYKVDKKGRYIFKGFHLIFKASEITLAPGKKFRETHDFKWEEHPGWSNPFRSVVPAEFAMTAIIELMTELENAETTTETETVAETVAETTTEEEK